MPRGYVEFKVTSADFGGGDLYTFGYGGSYRYTGRKGAYEFQRKISHDLMWSLDGTPDEAIAAIRRYSEPLVDAYISTDVEYGSYGDRDRDTVTLSGWEPITDAAYIENLNAILVRVQERETAEEQAVQERQREYAAAQIARLRAQFPDLV